jgi:hypothetical protein
VNGSSSVQKSDACCGPPFLLFTLALLFEAEDLVAGIFGAAYARSSSGRYSSMKALANSGLLELSQSS